MTAPLLPAPTVADVERIAALADPAVRNLQITQCYHELAVALAGRIGPHANWCCFATWASKQAGQSIRQEDLSRAFERLLHGSPETGEAMALMAAASFDLGDSPDASVAGAASAIWDALSPEAAFQRVSQAVARGNLKVFEEIGREMARFLAALPFSDEAALGRFLAGLRPGDPPEGQDYLRRAFTHYHQAAAEQDAKARSELLFLASLEIGFHEQTRLQPEIAESLNAPVYDPRELRRRLMDELFPNRRSRLRFLLARLAGRMGAVIRARDGLADRAQAFARQAITDLMMTLGLPGGRELRLGDDLPGEVPPTLQVLQNRDAQAMVGQIDLAQSLRRGTGVRDWSDLPQRMHFIGELFRVFHEDASLFQEPFSADQLALIRAGQRPAGPL